MENLTRQQLNNGGRGGVHKVRGDDYIGYKLLCCSHYGIMPYRRVVAKVTVPHGATIVRPSHWPAINRLRTDNYIISEFYDPDTAEPLDNEYLCFSPLRNMLCEKGKQYFEPDLDTDPDFVGVKGLHFFDDFEDAAGFTW
jgi:hypothetical protein